MDDTGDKVKHVATKAASGGIKGAMWGAIAVGILAAVSIGTALLTGGLSLLGTAAVWAYSGTIIGYAAAGGAALGALDGISSSNSVTEEKLSIQKREIAQNTMQTALQERQRAINAGMTPTSVLPPGMIPQQKQGSNLQMA